MDAKAKLDLVKRNAVEAVTEEELMSVLKKKQPIAYCGYEPSGDVHLGHMVTLLKLADCEKAGCKVKILLADVHAMLNRKGSEETLKKEIKNWKQVIKALGLKAEIVLGSAFQFEKDYTTTVMQLAQHTTLNRGLRSMQEVARDIDNATISQVLYPLMQVVDIKWLNADIALGGLEQRKIHMMGKEEQSLLQHHFVALHTPLITSLKGPGSKMSKSIPGSGIALTDSYETIKKSLNEAYCPQKEVKDNPVLQIAQLIVFPLAGKLLIKRPDKFGGNLTFKDYASLEAHYSQGTLHPLDLKNAMADALEAIIAPIRKKCS